MILWGWWFLKPNNKCLKYWPLNIWRAISVLQILIVILWLWCQSYLPQNNWYLFLGYSRKRSYHNGWAEFFATRRINGGKHRGKITASPFVGGREFWHQWERLEVYLKYWHRIGSCSHSAWKVYYWHGLPAAASWKWEKTFGQLG